MTSRKIALPAGLGLMGMGLIGLVLMGMGLASLSAWSQASITYPERIGVVSDYAGKLSEAESDELAKLLEHCEGRTATEFNVVVVKSLHGRSVGDYAKGIGDAWAVGQTFGGKGVVLLWAPNERAYSLRFTRGLSATISDSEAKTITQEYLLPNFRRGQYYLGLKQTALGTMSRLSSATAIAASDAPSSKPLAASDAPSSKPLSPGVRLALLGLARLMQQAKFIFFLLIVLAFWRGWWRARRGYFGGTDGSGDWSSDSGGSHGGFDSGADGHY